MSRQAAARDVDFVPFCHCRITLLNLTLPHRATKNSSHLDNWAIAMLLAKIGLIYFGRPTAVAAQDCLVRVNRIRGTLVRSAACRALPVAGQRP